MPQYPVKSVVPIIGFSVGAESPPQTSIILQSPNGTNFIVSIGNDGRLNSTPQAGGTEIIFSQVTKSGTVEINNPTGTTSTTYVMMGIGLVLSAINTTEATIEVDGQIANSGGTAESDLVLCYGIGTPPINGAAQTGTIAGSSVRFITASGGGDFVPFSITRLIIGLIPGDNYWFDVALKAVSGTASVTDLSIVAQGIST